MSWGGAGLVGVIRSIFAVARKPPLRQMLLEKVACPKISRWIKNTKKMIYQESEGPGRENLYLTTPVISSWRRHCSNDLFVRNSVYPLVDIIRLRHVSNALFPLTDFLPNFCASHPCFSDEIRAIPTPLLIPAKINVIRKWCV